jgi:hypothetical protein
MYYGTETSFMPVATHESFEQEMCLQGEISSPIPKGNRVVFD